MVRIRKRWLPPVRVMHPSRRRASPPHTQGSRSPVGNPARWDLRGGPARKGGPYWDYQNPPNTQPASWRGRGPVRLLAIRQPGLPALPIIKWRADVPVCRHGRAEQPVLVVHAERRPPSARVSSRSALAACA